MQKIWSAIKKFGAKFKNYRRIFNTSPTELIKIIINFISVGKSVGKTGF
jgi:predicted GTPase